MMQEANIDGHWYPAHAAVIKRMGEYYTTMVKALKRVEDLELSAKAMRDMQKGYFSTRDKTLIPQSKALEKEFDDLLAGREKPKPVTAQEELFR